MRDPQPENIAGEKVQRHVFKHEINWGYVALAVAAAGVGYLALSRMSDGGETTKPEPSERRGD